MMVAVLTHGGQESHCTCFHKRSTAVSSLVLILQRGLFPSLSLLQVPHCWAVAWCPKLSTALPVSVKYAEKFRSQVFGTKRFKVHVCQSWSEVFVFVFSIAWEWHLGVPTSGFPQIPRPFSNCLLYYIFSFWSCPVKLHSILNLSVRVKVLLQY